MKYSTLYNLLEQEDFLPGLEPSPTPKDYREKFQISNYPFIESYFSDSGVYSDSMYYNIVFLKKFHNGKEIKEERIVSPKIEKIVRKMIKEKQTPWKIYGLIKKPQNNFNLLFNHSSTPLLYLTNDNTIKVELFKTSQDKTAIQSYKRKNKNNKWEITNSAIYRDPKKAKEDFNKIIKEL